MIDNDTIDKVWDSRLVLNEPHSFMFWTYVFDKPECMETWAWKSGQR